MALTRAQIIYDTLCTAPGCAMTALALRQKLNMTSDELNHAGDRLVRINAVVRAKVAPGVWRWTASPGIDVSDKRGVALRGRLCAKTILRKQRQADRMDKSDDEARIMAWETSKQPLRSNLRHAIDIAWYDRRKALFVSGEYLTNQDG